jgi:hypothetical protein
MASDVRENRQKGEVGKMDSDAEQEAWTGGKTPFEIEMKKEKELKQLRRDQTW